MIESKTFLAVHHLPTGVEIECDSETAAILQGLLARARPRGVESHGALTVRVKPVDGSAERERESL